MFPYYCLVLIPMLITIIPLRKVKRNMLAMISFFAILILLLCLRSEYVGTDIRNYNILFNESGTKPWSEILKFNEEPAYFAINKLIFIMGGSFRSLMIVVAFLTILPICIYYIKNTNNANLTILLFVNMATFQLLFSGLRQAIAISIGVLAFVCLKDKKYILYFFCVLIAYFFHKSSFILLLLPICFIKVNNKLLLYIVPLMILIFLLKEQIFSILIKLLPDSYIEKYLGQTSATGAYGMLVLLALFTIFSFIITYQNFDKDVNALRNILIIATAIQCFAPVHALAMRFNYYFLIFIPMALPKMIENSSIKWKSIANLANIILIIFFFIYFFYNAYMGADILNIFPYIPFWRL